MADPHKMILNSRPLREGKKSPTYVSKRRNSPNDVLIISYSFAFPVSEQWSSINKNSGIGDVIKA